MKIAFRFVLVFALVSAIACAQDSPAQYYPLSGGNSWKYAVRRAGSKKITHVEWRVTKVDHLSTGNVYQVWPRPMQSDDDAMELRLSKNGIEEVSTNITVLKWPVSVGTEWAAPDGTAQTFRIRSIKAPCKAGARQYSDCLVVEDSDQKMNLRTVTSYARGVGPVKYEYFRIGTRGENKVQTVILTSHVVH
jgi:hypothetical protein